MSEKELIGKKLVRVEHWFIPPEAHTIASQLRSQAGEVRQQQARLAKVLAKLNGSWEGNARNAFISRIENIPAKLGLFARELESKADKVEQTKAMEYRWEWRDTK